jgi:very-short-patch-repair endonuclease
VAQDGITIAEIDIANPDILSGVEIDGPHRDLPEQRRRDELRDQRLRDLGWRIDRFRWEDVLADPTAFAARVRAAVEQRRQELGAR